jgi:hypothetical protein
MMHFFQEVADKFEALKADLFQAANNATSAVGNAVSFTADEVKTAETDFFTKLEGADVSISQAFAAGAAWAAARVSTNVAAPVAPVVVGNEPSPTAEVAAGASTENTSGAAASSVQS